MRRFSVSAPAAILFMVLVLSLAACGGSDNTPAQPGSMGSVSGHVPYIVSNPTVTWSQSGWDPAKYDLTIKVEADGPTGVAIVGLWVKDFNDDSNFMQLDLENIPGTNIWNTNTAENYMYYLPFAPGDYYLDSIILDDGDPFTANPLREGWYTRQPAFSRKYYYVAESELLDFDYVFNNAGVSAISVTTFTLP